MRPLSGRFDDSSGGNSPAPLMNVSQVSLPLHSQYLRSETSSEKVSDMSQQHQRGSSSGSTLPVAFPPIMSRFQLPELTSPRSSGINSAGMGLSLKEGVSFPVTPVKTPLHPRSPPPSPTEKPGNKMMALSFKERQRVSEQLHRFSSKERSAGLAPQSPGAPRVVAGRCGRVPKGTISFLRGNSGEGISSNAQVIGKGRCKPMKGEEGDDKAGTTDTRDSTPSLPQFSPVISPVTCERQSRDDNDSIRKDTFAVMLRQPSTVLSFKERQRRTTTLSPCFRRSPTSWMQTTTPNDSGCGLLRQACSFTTAPFPRELDGAKLERQPWRLLDGGEEDNPAATLSDDAGPPLVLLSSWGTPRGGDSSALVRQWTFPASSNKIQCSFAESSESRRSSLERTVTPRHIKAMPLSGKLSGTQNSRDNSRCAPGPVTPPIVSPRLIYSRVLSPSSGSSLKAKNDTAESLSTSAKVNTVKKRGSKEHVTICQVARTTSNVLCSSEVLEDPADLGSPPPKSNATVKQRRNDSAGPDKEGRTPLRSSASQGNFQTAASVGITSGTDRRERDKILKRPASYFSSQTPPLLGEDATMASKTDEEYLVQTPQNVDESSSQLESGSSTGRVEVSASRFPALEGFSVFAATRENGRKSSFSSLYFSMMKHHRSQRLMPNANQPSQMMPDEETNREVRGDSGFDELMNGDDDSFTGSLRTIGILETEEHVFLSRYELLPEGQTQMEIMLGSIRTIGGQSFNKSNSGPSSELRRGSFMNPSARHDRFDEEEGDSDDVFTFGSISPQYATDPVDEDPLVDCKVAARLLFDAEKGVMLISAEEEVGKYISQAACMGANNGVSGEEQSMCKCSQEFIAKDVRGVDYSRYHAHDLYHHCVYCNRRPAAFLCLHCLRSTCPSHVTRHYKECEAKCTLFLNLLDIMTSFDRIFWCEKCRCFTWKYTEVYDPLVDQLAVTRGTHLKEAVRDISCVGYEVQLKKLNHRQQQLSLYASPALEAFSPTVNASPNFSATPAPSAAASPMPFPMDSRHERLMSGANHNLALEKRSVAIDTTTSAAVAAGGLPIARLPQRDSGKPLPESEVLRMGEAVQKLVSLGAKVQGWRATQEDAEAAFVVAIPALSPQLLSDTDATSPPPKPIDSPEDAEPETIAMALFCVFDGHGGDAVAKLAASNFESHLRKAVASARHDDVQARSLLFQLDFESSTALFSVGEASPVAARENAFNRQLSRPDDEKDNEVSNDDIVPEVGFTSETLRRYVESTNACRASPPQAAPVPNFVAATADKPVGTQALFSMVDVGGLGDTTTDALSARSNLRLYNAASPVVSQREMEMLRAYFAGIMEDALLSLDDDLRQSPEGMRGDYQCTGCTACIVGITANFILCANLGDSGAAVYTPCSIRQISVTHRITDPAEESRIKAAGYAITGNRIEGMLAVTRALGDYDFKQCGGKGPKEQAVIAVPDVTIMPVPFLQDNARWGVVAACDGVWDSATLHQVHHAIINTPNDLDVAGSVMDAVLQAREMALALPQKASALLDGVDAAETASLDAQLLTSAAGIFAQCVAPSDNDEGIGMDNCSLFLIERR